MRLGQLARKLSIRPVEIVDFLGSRQITIEDGSNTRLDDTHVELILNKFAPFTTPEEVILVKEEKDEEPLVAIEESVAETSDVNEATAPPLSEVASSEETKEVIKAPKVELQGLKVLGKIELPEPKKKATDIPPEAEESATAEIPAEPRKRLPPQDRRPYRNSRPENKSARNPIAQAREREADEARRKREEEAEKAKEQRTSNYYKKVKVSSPTKRAKLIDEQHDEMAAIESQKPPSGWWGRIIHWFKS